MRIKSASLAFALIASALPVQGQVFRIGSPFGTISNGANCISRDGRVVYGYSRRTNTVPPWRWTAETGFADVQPVRSYTISSVTRANRDGSVVAGAFDLVDPQTIPSMFSTALWSPWNSTPIELAIMTGPSGLSDDGRAISYHSLSGISNRYAARYLDGRVDVISTGAGSYTGGISGDGQIVVGRTDSLEAFRWTEAGGRTILPSTAPPGWMTIATGISGDGNSIFGRVEYAGQTQFVRWGPDLQPEVLGIVPGDMWPHTYSESDGLRTSHDGGIVIGTFLRAGQHFSFGWARERGLLPIDQFLGSYGIDMSGWTTLRPTDISADGTRIVGRGSYQGGPTESLLIVIPAPASAALLAPIVLLAARRRR